MKPVMEYQNFRLYVRDYYAERKLRSGFTWRDFAKAAVKTAGPIMALGFLACMLLIIRSRRREKD